MIIPISDEKIDNLECTHPVKEGETGEVCLRGKGTALSYVGRPDDSDMAVIGDNGTFWLRTGILSASLSSGE